MTALELMDYVHAELSRMDNEEAWMEVVNWESNTVPWYAYDFRACLLRTLDEIRKSEREGKS